MWEGRFKSCLAQSEHFVRYIGLNIDRAGLIKHLADYPWSSDRFNGQGMANALLSQRPLYRALGKCNGERCRRYRELFRAYLKPELIDKIRQATNGNYVRGDARFSTEVEAM